MTRHRTSTHTLTVAVTVAFLLLTDAADALRIGAVAHVAGDTTSGFDTSDGLASRLTSPTGCAVDDNSTVFWGEFAGDRLRSMWVNATGHQLLLGRSPAENGTADGGFAVARMSEPNDVALMTDGVTLLVAETGNRCVRKYDIPANVIAAFVGLCGAPFDTNTGQTGTDARFGSLQQVWVDPVTGSDIFIVDYGHSELKKSTAAGLVTIVAGGFAGYTDDADPLSAEFDSPSAASRRVGTGDIFVCDTDNFRIRMVAGGTGAVTTVAGSATSGALDGAGNSAQLSDDMRKSVRHRDDVSMLFGQLHSVRIFRMDTAVVYTVINTAVTDAWSSSADATLAQVRSVRGVCFTPDYSRLFVTGLHGIASAAMETESATMTRTASRALGAVSTRTVSASVSHPSTLTRSCTASPATASVSLAGGSTTRTGSATRVPTATALPPPPTTVAPPATTAAPTPSPVATTPPLQPTRTRTPSTRGIDATPPARTATPEHPTYQPLAASFTRTPAGERVARGPGSRTTTRPDEVTASRTPLDLTTTPTRSPSLRVVNDSDPTYVPPVTTVTVTVSVAAGLPPLSVQRRAFCPAASNASLHNPPVYAACCTTRAAVGPAFECATEYARCVRAVGARWAVANTTRHPTWSTTSSQPPPTNECDRILACARVMFACVRDASVSPSAAEAGDCPWGAAMLAAVRTATRMSSFDNTELASDCRAEAGAIAISSGCGPSEQAASAICATDSAALPAVPPTAAQTTAADAGFSVLTGDVSSSARPTSGAGVDAVVVRGVNCTGCERSQAGVCGCRSDQQQHTVTVLHASYLTAPPSDACYTGAFEVLFCANAANATGSVSMFTSALPRIATAPSLPARRRSLLQLEEPVAQEPLRNVSVDGGNLSTVRFTPASTDTDLCELPNAETGDCSCPGAKSRRRLQLAVPGAAGPASPSLRNITFCAPPALTVMVLATDGSGACVQPLGSNYTCQCSSRLDGGGGGGSGETQSVALEVAYLNETTNEVRAGVFVVCGAVRVLSADVGAQAAVTTGVTVGASVAGGPAAPLIQGASMVYMMDCNPGDETNAANEGGRGAVVPFDIPLDRPRIGGFLAMTVITVGVTLLHVALVGLVACCYRIRAATTTEAAAPPGGAANSGGPYNADGLSPETFQETFTPHSYDGDHQLFDGDHHDGVAESDVPTAVVVEEEEEAPRYTTPYEHASTLMRFPNLSLRACLFGFQGLLFESLVLIRRDDRTAVEVTVGACGTVLCLGILVVTHTWGSAAGHEDVLHDAAYVPYTHVFAAVPVILKRVFLPGGFWRGKHAFVRRFGALFEAFEAGNVKWVASVHLVRATLISILSAIKPDDEAACRAVYITLACVFFGFGLLFGVTRPHRAPFDDVAAAVLNVATGVLALAVGLSLESVDRAALFLFVVYGALASVVVSVTLLVAELGVLRRRELAAQEAQEAMADRDDLAAAAASDVVLDAHNDDSTNGRPTSDDVSPSAVGDLDNPPGQQCLPPTASDDDDPHSSNVNDTLPPPPPPLNVSAATAAVQGDWWADPVLPPGEEDHAANAAADTLTVEAITPLPPSSRPRIPAPTTMNIAPPPLTATSTQAAAGSADRADDGGNEGTDGAEPDDDDDDDAGGGNGAGLPAVVK